MLPARLEAPPVWCGGVPSPQGWLRARRGQGAGVFSVDAQALRLCPWSLSDGLGSEVAPGSVFACERGCWSRGCGVLCSGGFIPAGTHSKSALDNPGVVQTRG